MPTRTQNRSSSSTSSSSQSAYSWSDNSGPLLAAGLAGAAIGFAANLGRKAIMQGIEAQAGDWDEILTNEHAEALALFDKMLATDETQTFKRKMLLMKLTHALDKHAHQEEMVVYPALREANEAGDADGLESEHGYKVRDFRQLVSEHAHMEEEQVFPRFKREMSGEQNDKITMLVNRDGFWMA